MMPELCSRTRAMVRGLDRYFTGKPCKHGHVAERRTSNHVCLECDDIRIRSKPRQHDRVGRVCKGCGTPIDHLYLKRDYCSKKCQRKCINSIPHFESQGFRWMTQNGKSFKVYLNSDKPDKCENPFCDSTKLHFEHDHVSLTHRGWLCENCNRALGLLGENPDRIRWIAKYAEERCL